MTFQALALKNRADKIGRKIYVTEEYRLLNALMNGNEPTPPRFSNWLWHGLRTPNFFFRTLRVFRDLIPNSSFKRKRLFMLNRDNDTVAISNTPFMEFHAKTHKNTAGSKVVLISFWEWFSVKSEDKKKMHRTPPIDEGIVAKVIAVAKQSFSNHGENLPELMTNYFHSWIRKASIPVRFYYERMINQPDKLPKTLWYGSTNHLWTRMLRCAVKTAGGYCVGHDHGRGVATYPNRGEHGVVLDLCDEYVSYSTFLSRQFEILSGDIKKALPDGLLPKFTSSSELALLQPVKYLSEDVDSSPTRIMYLAPQYFGERVYLNCLPSDVVTVDWQIRLITALNSWKLDILYKCHPENTFDIPPAILSVPGLNVIKGYIEDCYNITDVFVFDFISSPFRTIAFTNKAIIFIDFGIGDITDEAYSVLSKRCAIVTGWYDDENRAQVNWDEMKAAIDVSRRLSKDRTCVEMLFGTRK